MKNRRGLLVAAREPVPRDRGGHCEPAALGRDDGSDDATATDDPAGEAENFYGHQQVHLNRCSRFLQVIDDEQHTRSTDVLCRAVQPRFRLTRSIAEPELHPKPWSPWRKIVRLHYSPPLRLHERETMRALRVSGMNLCGRECSHTRGIREMAQRWPPNYTLDGGADGRGWYASLARRWSSCHERAACNVRAYSVLDEFVMDCEQCKLQAVRCACPVEDVRQVMLDGVLGDPKLLGQIAIRVAGDDQREDFALPVCQAKVWPGSGRI